MRERMMRTYRPGLLPLEERRPLSVGATAAPLARPDGPRATAPRPLPSAVAAGARAAAPETSPSARPPSGAAQTVSIDRLRPNFGYLMYRITNPNRFNNKLVPPFGHVLVQNLQPVPGQVYNVLYLAVRNGTAQTFDASSGFQVRFPQVHGSFPILTGDETWKPGQDFIFYVLTKWYYPLPNQVTSGFVFNLGGARAVGIPGPSGIFQRLKYDPSTFNRMLDQIVTHGVGAQGGRGIRFGMPDTALDEIVSAKTRRNDYTGYF